MNERELRIGNYVNRVESLTDDKLGIICFQKSDWYRIGECIDFLSAYKPIPLTEEWLLKFGFEKEKFSTDEYDCSYTMYSFGAFYKKEDYFLPKPYYFSDAFGDNFKLRYVHQLQNLYFALTEDELELKK